MVSPDLFSLIFSFLPQCLDLVTLISPVNKAWRNEVTTAPRTTASLITAHFTIALLTTWQARRLAETWVALRWERCFGEAGEAAGQFYNPSCVLPLTEPLTGLKRLVVADTQNHRIQICDREGLPQLCSSPCLLDDEDGLPKPGLFNFPAALAHDDDSLYVVDATGRLLQLRLADLALIDAVGGRGFQDGQMFGAGGLAFAAGCIFVADNSNRRVAVWDTAPLRWRGVVGGGQGSGPGEISYPVDVAVHSAPLPPPPPSPTQVSPLAQTLHPRPNPSTLTPTPTLARCTASSSSLPTPRTIASSFSDSTARSAALLAARARRPASSDGSRAWPWGGAAVSSSPSTRGCKCSRWRACRSRSSIYPARSSSRKSA